MILINPDGEPKPKKALKTILSAKKAFENEQFLKSRDARTLRILSEYLHPEMVLKKRKIYNTIVFFGSARTISSEEYKEKMNELMEKAANDNSGLVKREIERMKRLEFTCRYHDDCIKLTELVCTWAKTVHPKNRLIVCTGGGPGMMEAASRGAYNTDSPAIAYNIALPFEQKPNDYVDETLNFDFHYFFMRKFWFVYHAKAIVVMPGGYGTLDELTEMLTLEQTGSLSKKVPIVLYGKEYWEKLINFKYLAEIGMINKEDLNLFRYCDDPYEAFEYIKDSVSAFLHLKRQG